jgi:energy-coupling factor transporter ATP-binding protein EcfA2
MLGADPNGLFNITDLGTTLFLGNAVISILLLYFVIRGNVPVSIPTENYAKVFVARIVVAVLLAMMASTPATGPAAPLAGMVGSLALLGPGYFVYSMIFDVIIAAILRRLEFYGAYKIVVFNLLSIPFVTSLALLWAYREQNKTLGRAEWDLAYKKDGVVLGEAVQVVRMVSQPIQTPTQARMTTHYDIRPLPRKVKTYYKPENVPERDFNPHAIIAGTSGSGKTTLLYHLIRDLSASYPVIFVDVKGDISRALLRERVSANIVHIASVGVNPFTRIADETSNELVERLMDSISVVEPVGSRQEHLIREAVIQYCGRKEDGTEERPPSYPAIVSYLRRYVKSVPPPEVRWGMGGGNTRDALFSIYSKLEDLGRYFRDDGASVPQIILRALKTPEGGRREKDFPVTVFNLEDISEKFRAIVLELILRNIAKLMYHRGPTAFLKDKALVLVVDEAYLVTRPMTENGRIGGNSRSILEEVARAGRSYGLALILATQRLSDVADGIRQNCQTWICFYTTSPEDTKILKEVDAEVMASVVSELDPGEAYIRAPSSRRREYYRSTTDTVAAIVGYIFRMERKLLQVEEEGARRILQRRQKGEAEAEEITEDTIEGSSLLNYGQVCYRCMLITADPAHCPTCGQPPLTKRPEPEQTVGSGDVDKSQKQQPSKPSGGPVRKPEGENIADMTNEVDLSEAEELVAANPKKWEKVLEKAVQKADEKTATMLADLSLEEIALFITEFLRYKTNGELTQNILGLVKLGVVKPVTRAKRVMPSKTGKILLEAYKEVFGNE